MTLEDRTLAAVRRAEARYSKQYTLRTAQGDIAFKAIRRPPTSIPIEDPRHVTSAWEFLVSREWIELFRCQLGDNALFNGEVIVDDSTIYTLDRVTPCLAMSGTDAYFRILAYKQP